MVGRARITPLTNSRLGMCHSGVTATLALTQGSSTTGKEAMKKTLVGLAAFATTLALAPGAGAATITVSTTADPNSDGAGTLCSVREAVAAAVANADGTTGCDDTVERIGAYGTGSTADEIVLNSAANYELTEGQISVGAGGPIVIRSDNPAVRRTINMVDLTGENRILLLNDAATDLTLRGLRITNADDVLTGTGGVVYAQNDGSKLTVENSEVNATKAGRNAKNGGVIAVNGFGSSLTIRDSMVTGGEVSQNGGGIHSNGAPVTIERSSIHTNTSDSTIDGSGRGGGIYADINGNSTLTMSDSEVYDNHVTTTCSVPCQAAGGGMSTGKPATIKRSLISDNTVTSAGGAYEYGGGLYGEDTLNIFNTTFHNNVAGSTGQGIGGAILTYGPATLANDTFAGNHAQVAGDDLGAIEAPSDITYTGSILGGTGDPCWISNGSLTSLGYNAIASTDCPSVASDSVGGAIGLAGALADNGGTVVGGTGGAPIRTLAISNAGTAFNLVPIGVICAAAEGTDQRGAGFTRPVGDACDAGAFEVQPPPTVTPPPGPTPPATTTPGPTGQRAAALKKCKKKHKKNHNAKQFKKCKKKANRLPV
jgi:hypothetical protein